MSKCCLHWSFESNIFIQYWHKTHICVCWACAKQCSHRSFLVVLFPSVPFMLHPKIGSWATRIRRKALLWQQIISIVGRNPATIPSPLVPMTLHNKCHNLSRRFVHAITFNQLFRLSFHLNIFPCHLYISVSQSRGSFSFKTKRMLSKVCACYFPDNFGVKLMLASSDVF